MNELIDDILKHRRFDPIVYDPVADFLKSITRSLPRPGVTEMLTKALDSFVKEEMPVLKAKFSVVLLADSIGLQLAHAFMIRKGRMEMVPNAQLAKIGLLFKKSFISATARCITNSSGTLTEARQNREDLCNQRMYLRDHLYYISNPQDAKEFVFLTFPVDPSAPRDENDSRLDVISPMSDGTIGRFNWKFELTHFKEHDICTLLAVFLSLLWLLLDDC